MTTSPTTTEPGHARAADAPACKQDLGSALGGAAPSSTEPLRLTALPCSSARPRNRRSPCCSSITKSPNDSRAAFASAPALPTGSVDHWGATDGAAEAAYDVAGGSFMQRARP